MNTSATTAPSAPEAETELARVGPPVFVLLLGAASVAVSLALLVVDDVAVDVVGYLLGSVVAILCIALYRKLDLLRRKDPGYVPRPGLRPVVPALAVGALVASALHAWPIATHFAS